MGKCAMKYATAIVTIKCLPVDNSGIGAVIALVNLRSPTCIRNEHLAALFNFTTFRRLGLWYLAYEAASLLAFLLYAGHSTGHITSGL